MKRILLVLTFLVSVCCNIRCIPKQEIILHDPQAEKSLLVGAILVENVGLEDVYEAKKANIVVIVVGNSLQDGHETSQGYRVKTNQDGYYMIPNVPQGSYVIKGIELDLGYETHMLIGSYWEGTIQKYIPETLMIDYTVPAWPAPINERIINMNIRYFKIDAAKRIAFDTFKRLESASVSLPQIRHTMPNPLQYFKTQFPASPWFQN